MTIHVDARSAAGPLRETLARLTATDDDGPRVEVGDPSGDRWLALDNLVEGGGLDTVFDDAAPHALGSPGRLGASVASSLAGAVVTAGWPTLLIERRLPDLSPHNLVVHRHADAGWFDRIAIRTGATWLLAEDASAGHPDAHVVADLDALRARFVDQLVSAVSPWFAAVRARAPFGRRGLWGQLADDLCGTALWTARRLGYDQRAAWNDAHAVVDLVAARVPGVTVRPRLFPVGWTGGEALFQVRGTCCLWYTTQEAPDPCGDGYCATCPLRDDDARRSRLTGWLEQAVVG